MNTPHGFHIPGTEKDHSLAEEPAMCGGIPHCWECGMAAARAMPEVVEALEKRVEALEKLVSGSPSYSRDGVSIGGVPVATETFCAHPGCFLDPEHHIHTP